MGIPVLLYTCFYNLVGLLSSCKLWPVVRAHLIVSGVYSASKIMMLCLLVCYTALLHASEKDSRLRDYLHSAAEAREKSYLRSD